MGDKPLPTYEVLINGFVSAIGRDKKAMEAHFFGVYGKENVVIRKQKKEGKHGSVHS